MLENEIKSLEERLKELKKKFKEENKPKTFTVKSDVHNKVKLYCQLLGINISEWVEKTLKKEIDCLEFDNYDEYIENESKKILKKYTINQEEFIVKSDKLIIDKKFKFLGYSIIDGLPCYNFIDGVMENDLVKSLEVNLKRANKGEITNNPGLISDFKIATKILIFQDNI